MSSHYFLNNGVNIPKIMLGTYGIFGEDAKRLFIEAYKTGYRGIDCGRYYNNEKDWGDAVKASGVDRHSVFIQTKVSHAEEKKKIDIIRDFETTLKNFSTDYIDCLLIHWPNIETMESTWNAMEKLYRDGKVLAIGVSNFRIEHFELLKSFSSTIPMVLQLERHPCRHQNEMYEYCQDNKIQFEAYQPIATARPELMYNPILLELANKYNCTVPQVSIAWNILTGVIPLPRTKNLSRLKENFASLEIQLQKEDVRRISEDKSHYCRVMRESLEYPGYWDYIHRVDVEKYLN